MSEMIDRVASALEEEFFKGEELDTGRGIVTPERLARAAIAAMRERCAEIIVTPEMIKVGVQTYLAWEESDDYSHSRLVEDLYRKMWRYYTSRS